LYIFIENNFFINLKEIVSIISYENYKLMGKTSDFFEVNRRKIIDLSSGEKKSVIITDKNIYVSSYTCRTLESRGNEYINIKYKLR